MNNQVGKGHAPLEDRRDEAQAKYDKEDIYNPDDAKALYECEVCEDLDLNNNKLELYPQTGSDPGYKALKKLLAANPQIAGFIGPHDAGDQTGEVMIVQGVTKIQNIVCLHNQIGEGW
eukprot:m51a1_g13382 hypothetical protein (118) ;mRNA; r:59-682